MALHPMENVTDATDEAKENDSNNIDAKSHVLSIAKMNIDDEVAYERRLQKMIENSYPNINKLWMYNPKGTLKILQAFKSVTFKRKYIKVSVEHTNKDNIVTWQEYKTLIGKFWYKVNSDPWLETARNVLTDELHREHFKVLPFWPNPGETAKRVIEFNKKSNYNHNDRTIYWTAVGFVNVKDIRKEISKFYTECESDCVTLKVLLLDHAKTRQVEQLCIKNFEKAKQTADKKATDKTEAITWEDI